MKLKKESCLPELKSLADSLTDRDIGLKSCYLKVKEIINDTSLCNEQKVLRIKEAISENGN